MRICRFDGNRFGIWRDDRIVEVTEAFGSLPSESYPFPCHDRVIEHLPMLKPEIEHAAETGASFALSDLALDSPVANPGKLVAAPVNYAKHLREVRDQVELHHQNQSHMRKIQEVR